MKYYDPYRAEKIIGVILAFIIFVVFPVLIVFGCHQESKRYNKLTGANTTWKDAFFLELRVQHDPK